MIIIILTVLSTFDTVTEVIDTIEEARTNSESVKNTYIIISNLTASTASNTVTFNLDSKGIQKLWNFQKFDLFVTYNNGTTRVTETLPYTEGVVNEEIVFRKVTTFTGDCDSCQFTHNNPSAGDDRILIVGITPKKIASLSSVTYDGQSLSKIRSDEYPGVVESSLWYLVNPSTGPNPVIATLAEKGEVIIGAMSFTNVDQTNPIYQHAGANGESVTPTIDVDALCESMLVSTLSTLDGPLTPLSGQTERWSINFASMYGIGSTLKADTPGTYTVEWTNTAGKKEFAITVTALKASGGVSCIGGIGWSLIIINDAQEPGIINKDEIGYITASLQYPVATGPVTVQIVTDSGVTSSLSISVS